MRTGRWITGRGATILLLLLVISGAAFAQSGRGKIHGYVAFEDFSYEDVRQGKVRATVILSQERERHSFADTLQTDDHGSYDFDDIYAGEYTLRITAPGHKAYETELYIPSDFICSLAVMLKKNK